MSGNNLISIKHKLVRYMKFGKFMFQYIKKEQIRNLFETSELL